jgi:hypothetical protein
MLDEKKNKGRAKSVTQILSGMVRTVTKYLKVFPQTVLEERRTRSERGVTANDFIVPSSDGNSKQSSKNLNRANKDLANTYDPPSSYKDILEEIIPVLDGYFSIFSSRFNSSLVSDRWIEASSIFLVDLSNTLKSLQK